MSGFRVLLLDSIHPLLPDMLRGVGFEVTSKNNIDYDSLYEIIAGYDGLIIRNSPRIDRKLIDRAKGSLKFIARAGSGLEHIDYDYACRSGVEVLHTPEGNADAVGEHAVGMLIALLKDFLGMQEQVRQGKWPRKEFTGQEISSKIIGIIGYGNTGMAFARKLKSFGCKVIAYDKYKTEFTDELVEEVMLEQLLQQADVISFHVPLTVDTYHYADDFFFERLNKPIILLNTSRGQVVSIKSLAKALREGKVWAAGLDVMEWETDDFQIDYSIFYQDEAQYLMQHPRVLITPHIAGITEESKFRHASLLVNKIMKLLKGSSY